MARIRSVHPGLFTDESFASLTSDAQMFLIGLWTEADDQGVFEWKPVTLRMRLRPTKDGDVSALLEEIESVNCIMSFESGGKKYGAIRNFRKYQRPKSPNAVHPTTDDVRSYVGLTQSISEIDRDEEASFPPSEEIAPQMEDVGGKRKKKGGGAGAPDDTPMAFVGKVIRLKREDYDDWRRTYCNVPDFDAELRAADCYYADNPPKGGKWFFPVSNWLKRTHEQNKPKPRFGL